MRTIVRKDTGKDWKCAPILNSGGVFMSARCGTSYGYRNGGSRGGDNRKDEDGRGPKILCD
jgi:hypothetical protein